MMDKNMTGEMDLDALFAEAAGVQPVLSPALADRIFADAARTQPKPQPLVRPVISTEPERGFFGWFAGFADVLGGGRSLAGLSLAGLTGLYLGVAQPTFVQSLTSLVSGSTTTLDSMDLLPATGTLWTDE